jgi:hypothetical protein
MPSVTVYKEVEVDVDLDDFDTEDLAAELERREYTPNTDPTGLLTRIYEQRKMGLDYQRELDELFWITLGRII